MTKNQNQEPSNRAHTPRLVGVMPVLPVPFHANEEVDEQSFGKLVRWASARNIDGLVLFGLASEYWKLSIAEREKLVDILQSESCGTIPTLISVTESSRNLAVKEATRYASCGATALIVMPPSFMSPKVANIIDHCRAVADAVAPLPVIIQYSPAYVGNTISVADFVQMNAKSPNIQYVKVEPRPPGPMIEAINRASEGKLQCFIGQGGLTLADCQDRGIAGIMPGVGILEIYRQLWNQLDRKNSESPVWELHDRMVSLISHIVPTMDMWVAAEKRILFWRNVIPSDGVRSPSSLPDAAFFDLLAHLYKRIVPYLEKPAHDS